MTITVVPWAVNWLVEGHAARVGQLILEPAGLRLITNEQLNTSRRLAWWLHAPPSATASLATLLECLFEYWEHELVLETCRATLELDQGREAENVDDAAGDLDSV